MLEYLEGASEGCLFRGKLIEYSRAIRENFPKSDYDHRPYLPELNPPWDKFKEQIMTEQFRLGYACFKREVAKVLQPKTIVEIGVGIGISALAFLDGCPKAKYLGIDNDVEEKRDFPVQPTGFVTSLLYHKGYDFGIVQRDSHTLEAFPDADLIHVDGAHDYYSAIQDVILAWRTKSPWILVDDCRDSTVAAAVMWVLHNAHPGSTDWAYFEDTWTGSILISREVARP